MSDEIQEARRAVENWRLGQTSARYESSGQGAGVISTGKGDHGGVSYGAYQLSTKMGTLKEYLDQSSYGAKFTGLVPATPAFNAKWKELAKNDPGFAQDQHDFIGRTHYAEQMESLKAAGIDLSGRGRGVQDAIWSTSVQFRGLTPRIVSRGLVEKFGDGYDLSKLSDRDVIEGIQDYKISHNSSLFRSSPEWQPGLLRRASSEKEGLVRLALQEEVLGLAGKSIGAASGNVPAGGERQSAASGLGADTVLAKGERGDRVRSLQDCLSSLGYTDARSRPLKADGNFGANTESAVRRFQEAHGLSADGIVGEDTRRALAKAERTPLVSERTHPDYPVFQEARNGLRQLPAGTFRNDLELDNAAAAMTAKARQAGMAHIDHVVPNTRGDSFIAVQGGLQDPARQMVSVEKQVALTQSIERSTAQMSESAMAQQQAAQASTQMQHMEHRNGFAVGVRP